jgi:hypothetical protein
MVFYIFSRMFHSYLSFFNVRAHFHTKIVIVGGESLSAQRLGVCVGGLAAFRQPHIFGISIRLIVLPTVLISETRNSKGYLNLICKNCTHEVGKREMRIGKIENKKKLTCKSVGFRSRI